MKQLKFALVVLLVTLTGFSLADGIEEDFKKAGEAAKAGDYKTAIGIWRPLADQGHVSPRRAQ